MTDLYELTWGLASQAAATVASRYRGFADLDDIRSEVMLWCFSTKSRGPEKGVANEVWIREELEGDDGRPTPWGEKNVLRQFTRIGTRWARREKAAKEGYEPQDEFFYSRGMLEEFLPHVWTTAVLERAGEPGTRSHKDPAEGGDLAAMVQDVRFAYGLLTPRQQDLLSRRYRYNVEPELLAQEEECALSTLYARVGRILDAMVETLGGVA